MVIKNISDYPDITFLLEEDRDLHLLQHNYKYFVTPDAKRRFNEIMVGIGSYKNFLSYLQEEYEIKSLLVLMPLRMSESIKEYAVANIAHQNNSYRAFNFNVAYHV